jgi:DNA repair exonuclease SbcCD ATPase subunit
MIIFRKLRWKNILSTGNIFTEIDLNADGTTLIVGENGAGKSTILDALTFALFGKSFRNINKPQLINTITRKDAVVEIEFSIGQNEYKIIRGLKPSVFEVYCNGSLLNQSAEMKDYQEHLEKHIIKINYKSFCQVVILGTASFVPFMQLPAAQRRAIIEDLLDLQVFTTMNTLLKEKVQQNNIDIQENETEKKLINAKIKLVKDHLKELQNKNELFVKDKRETVVHLQNQITKSGEEKLALERSIQALKYRRENAEPFSSKLKKLNTLKAQLEAKMETHSKEIKFFEKHDNCPTCKQLIDSDFRCETISKKTDEINEITSGLQILFEKYEETQQKLNAALDIETQISAINSDILPITIQINHWFDQITQIEKEINKVRKQSESSFDLKVVDLENVLTNLSNSYNILMEDKQVLAAAAMLLKDGGIKTKIINQYIPVINKLINKYLSAMDFFVDFQLNGQFEETIKSRYRDEFSYASFSEGEKFRINLALLFAWRAVAKMRNSASTNLLILDEVMDSSLDSNGTEEFMKILLSLTKDTNTFIISHRTEQISDKFDNIIRFEKHKNFSRISE